MKVGFVISIEMVVRTVHHMIYAGMWLLCSIKWVMLLPVEADSVVNTSPNRTPRYNRISSNSIE